MIDTDRPTLEIIRGLVVLPRNPQGNREGFTTGASASIAANRFSIARAEGAPSVSLRWIVSLSSSRTSA